MAYFSPTAGELWGFRKVLFVQDHPVVSLIHFSGVSLQIVCDNTVSSENVQSLWQAALQQGIFRLHAILALELH